VTVIPLVDLAAQHADIQADLLPAIDKVLANGNFILGAEVLQFEKSFASYCESQYCVGVANGTDAIELALRSTGVGPGDEVVLPANTFIATALAVVRSGATPVLVDCDPVFGLIDFEQAAAAITERTRAVIPVHLYGQIAHSEQFADVAATKECIIIADAAQAQGAKRNGRSIGAWSDLAATSFYPGKNLGAYGDAGAVLAQSPDVASRLLALRNYGSDVKYHHPEIGFNSRLDTLQAVVLSAKLTHLDKWNRARQRAAKLYDEMLTAVDEVRLPQIVPGNEHVFHLYVIEVPKRQSVLAALQNQGIGAGVHYPIPIHLQPSFAGLGHRPGSFPVSEAKSEVILSLPLYPHITPEQQATVVAALKKALAER
jgi:dTDP-4-amino-4,6-dideoxygalactose transaminase